MVDRIFDTFERWHPRVIGIEANAMQLLFGNMVDREARQRGIRLPTVPIYQPPTVKKPFRIRAALQSVIAQGRLVVGAEQRELWVELISFPQGPTCDLVDALASAVVLLPARVLPQQRQDEIAGLASYLRQSGMPARYIEERVAEVKAQAERG
jgi:hypothetical protein